MLTRGQVVEPAVDESQTVNVVLRAGQATLHHGRMCHASSPNRSSERRLGFSVRYIAPHMQQTVGVRDYGVLVQGEDRFGHFESPPPPKEDFEPERLALYEQAQDRRKRILYQGTDAKQAQANRVPGG